jgi:hypothetical protein
MDDTETAYIRGVRFMYDFMADKQMVLFLCCRSNETKIATIECDSMKLEKMDGKSSTPKNSILVQATSTGEAGELPMLAKFCPVVNVPLCPLEKIVADLFGNAGNGFGVGSDIPGLEGLSGIAGVAGLALVKIPTCPRKMISGYTLITGSQVIKSGITSLDQCITICDADAAASLCVFDPLWTTCYVRYGATTSIFPVSRDTAYVKTCIATAVPQLG